MLYHILLLSLCSSHVLWCEVSGCRVERARSPASIRRRLREAGASIVECGSGSICGRYRTITKLSTVRLSYFHNEHVSQPILPPIYHMCIYLLFILVAKSYSSHTDIISTTALLSTFYYYLSLLINIGNTWPNLIGISNSVAHLELQHIM